MPKGIYQHRKGYKLSEKTRKRISEGHKGHLMYKSTERNQKISKANKGTKKPWAGKYPHFNGEKAPNWQGGISFEPYSVDWTESLRRTIRERDHYICQLCWKPQGNRVHSVHHKDYNKLNCNPENLITLCVSCNGKVNKNRNYWVDYFLKK